MTNAEIKKAWEMMKKEIKKELGFEGGFTMSQKQINNRTATFLVCNTIPYETEIRRTQEIINRVMGYDSWTDTEKARSKAKSEECIADYTARMKQFGTKENEVQETLTKVTNSKAFKKFAGNFENVLAEVEEMQDCYYIRFCY